MCIACELVIFVLVVNMLVLTAAVLHALHRGDAESPL
jgi:hypothetical protein